MIMLLSYKGREAFPILYYISLQSNSTRETAFIGPLVLIHRLKQKDTNFKGLLYDVKKLFHRMFFLSFCSSQNNITRY